MTPRLADLRALEMGHQNLQAEGERTREHQERFMRKVLRGLSFLSGAVLSEQENGRSRTSALLEIFSREISRDCEGVVLRCRTRRGRGWAFRDFVKEF